MSVLVELGSAILSQAERRVEIAGENVANVATPGYKRRVAFATLLDSGSGSVVPSPQVHTTVDFSSGKMQTTRSPSDIAIAGRGYFLLQSEDQKIYTRKGQFSVNADGRLVNELGYALQLENGNDLVLASGDFEIRPDRTVVQDGAVLGRVAVFEAGDERQLRRTDGGFLSTGGELGLSRDAMVYQGVIETSNVAMGNEMVVIMEALRRAESGQRVISVYDDLMARVITVFGESAR